MYTIYKTSRGKLLNLKEPANNCWINFTSPTKKDLKKLKQITNIPDIDIEDLITSVRDKEEVPKVEQVENYQFILIQTPHESKKDDSTTYSVAPLAILYNNNHVITISNGNNDVIDYIKLKLKNFEINRLIDTSKRQQIILKLILFSAKIYLRYLKVISSHIASTQSTMGKSAQDRDIIRLMDVGKSLVYFNISLISNHVVVEKLAKRKMFNSTETDLELIEDALDENRQAIDTVKIYDRIVNNAVNTFSNVISNNLNKTVKFLTSITIILTIPALVANVYGMNVALPIQNEPDAFGIIVLVSIALTIVGVLWFFSKKLF